MNTRIAHALLTCFFIGGCAAAVADPVVEDAVLDEFAALEAESEVRFERVDGTGQAVTGQLINGVPVDPRHFPGVLRMVTGGTCTAALIGPATILLAAHCVGHNQRIAFATGASTVKGICQRAPGYNPHSHEQDWALCLLQKKIGNIVFERVKLDAVPAVGKSLALTGYGCTMQNGPLDGKLRLGRATVAAKPPGWAKERAALYTKANVAAGEAVLCPGDSGGPLFDTGDDLAGRRSIVGVNSRTTYQFGVSIFAALGSTEGSAFMRDFAAKHKQKICGVNLTLGCKAE